jgi:hypothetical protein
MAKEMAPFIRDNFQQIRMSHEKCPFSFLSSIEIVQLVAVNSIFIVTRVNNNCVKLEAKLISHNCHCVYFAAKAYGCLRRNFPKWRP